MTNKFFFLGMKINYRTAFKKLDLIELTFIIKLDKIIFNYIVLSFIQFNIKHDYIKI